VGSDARQPAIGVPGVVNLRADRRIASNLARDRVPTPGSEVTMTSPATGFRDLARAEVGEPTRGRQRS
jgi:hypothetical protein